MRLEECASCFNNKRSGAVEKIKFVHKLFPMKITKRANECVQCAKRRHIKIFDKHNVLSCLAGVSAGGIEINWARFVKILRISDASRKYGAIRVLMDLDILLTRPHSAYGIFLDGMVMGPVINNFLTLYFRRKSDAAEFASLATIGSESYKIVEMKGAA